MTSRVRAVALGPMALTTFWVKLGSNLDEAIFYVGVLHWEGDGGYLMER